jgi:hypothetical protein
MYVEGVNPRRTPSRAKRAIYGWTLVRALSNITPFGYDNFQKDF